MTSGENIHNAFVVVYKTLQSVEKLMIKCRAELDAEKYYMPTERFMRYSSDSSWEGWIYWSFILLFQKHADGAVMKNEWINGPVYAVEINVDPDTCAEPKLYIAKMEFTGMPKWTKGCSPANHSLFYDAIHFVDLYEKQDFGNGLLKISPKPGYEQRVSDSFWGFQSLIRYECNLVDVKQDNYKEKIFGEIEKLSVIQ